ncbi:MAG: TrkH family potassium uptake protein [Clostridia bacterium]|nr:TrkH family potassium uptake protein [Clostridia bacterium]
MINSKMIFYVLGRLSFIEAAFLLVSLFVSLVCGNLFKGDMLLIAYLIPIVILVTLGFALSLKKPNNSHFYAKEGFVVVAASWFLMSLFGALPSWISGYIPSFIDAFFETASGFTTTGSSILTDIEALPKGLLFWRSFTHWIGGMGVLVFMLAIFPEQETQSIFLMKAESPGPQVGKIVSKLRATAQILYGIYLVFTLVEMVMLLFGGLSFYDSVVTSFATAGTGGFAIYNDSIGHYRNVAGVNYIYCEYVISAFMILFGVNFNIFYLMLIKRFKEAFSSEEVLTYLAVVLSAIGVISLNTFQVYGSVEETIRNAFFNVSSLISTTGFGTVSINDLPQLSKTILIILMFFGACAGSTGGGVKIARVILWVKSGFAEIRRCISPNSVISTKYEGKKVDSTIVRSTNSYLVLYLVIFIVSTLLVSLDGFDFESTFTGVLSCFNNIGPGFGKMLGVVGNFSQFSNFSKLVLIFDMIAGRLELLPVMVLFSFKTYKK